MMERPSIAQILSTLLIPLVLTGCWKEKNQFQPGTCIHAVDGYQIYKLQSIEGKKMLGFIVRSGKASETLEEIPSERIYTPVPCPPTQP